MNRANRIVRTGLGLLRPYTARLHNFSWLVVINSLAAGISFLTTAKLTHVLSKERFGEVAYALALGTYGATFARCGVDRTLVRDLVHFPHRTAELVGASMILRGGALILAVSPVVFWKSFAGTGAPLSWGAVAIYLGVTFLSMDLQPVYDAWIEMRRHALYNLVQKFSYFSLVWLVVLGFPARLSIAWIGFASMSSVLMCLTLEYRWAMRRVDWSEMGAWPREAAVSMARENIWVWLASIGCLSFGSLNQLILSHYCGKAALGPYAAMWQTVMIVVLLLTQISRVGNPVTAAMTRPGVARADRVRFLARYTAVMLVAASVVCAPAVVAPRTVIALIFPSSYVAAAPILRLLGLYTLVFSAGVVAAQYVVSARMEKAYFASVMVGGVLGGVFCFVLIPKYGGLGAALALLLSHGLSMALYGVAVVVHLRHVDGAPESGETAGG